MENNEKNFTQSYINEVDEKVEKELNNINEIINNINLDLDELLQLAQDKIKAVQEDYDDIETDFNKN